MEPKFLTGEPALLLPGRVLVVADLHLGIEHEFRKSGVRLPHQTGKLLEKTRQLVHQTGAKRLIILGDVKHKVPGMTFQEEREVPHFLNALKKIVDAEVAPGNHDGGLKNILPDVKFHPPGGFLLGDVYLLHGHAWPTEDFLKARHVLMGHNHPMIEFRDRLGYAWREPVWVRAGLDRKKLGRKFSKLPRELPELVIFPAFNEMAGGRPLNKQRNEGKPRLMGPLGRAAKRSSAGVYLLDGTFLGGLGKL